MVYVNKHLLVLLLLVQINFKNYPLTVYKLTVQIIAYNVHNLQKIYLWFQVKKILKYVLIKLQTVRNTIVMEAVFNVLTKINKMVIFFVECYV
jgi:hypothetical protein